MKENFYLVLHQTEDGHYIDQMSKTELLARLNSRYYGKEGYNLTLPEFSDGQFKVQGTTILKVEAVVRPKEVKSFIEYTID